MNLDWDTEILSVLIKEWNDLLNILNDLDSIKVNRNVFVNYENGPIVKPYFHGFSDASLLAYGATIYFKDTHRKKHPKVKLQCLRKI